MKNNWEELGFLQGISQDKKEYINDNNIWGISARATGEITENNEIINKKIIGYNLILNENKD